MYLLVVILGCTPPQGDVVWVPKPSGHHVAGSGTAVCRSGWFSHIGCPINTTGTTKSFAGDPRFPVAVTKPLGHSPVVASTVPSPPAPLVFQAVARNDLFACKAKDASDQAKVAVALAIYVAYGEKLVQGDFDASLPQNDPPPVAVALDCPSNLPAGTLGNYAAWVGVVMRDEADARKWRFANIALDAGGPEADDDAGFFDRAVSGVHVTRTCGNLRAYLVLHGVVDPDEPHCTHPTSRVRLFSKS